MKLWLVLLATVLIVACKQDPLADASESVKRNNPPHSEKLEVPKAFPKEALQIHAPQIVDAYAGSELKIEIEAQVMVEAAEFSLQVHNLESFPGAQFDAATGIFTWRPEKAFLGGQAYIKIPLKVSLYLAPGPKHVASREEKEIMVVVFNDFAKPVIQSLKGPETVIGGKSYSFEFSVFDIEARNKSEVTVHPWDCADNFHRSASTLSKVKETLRADSQTPGLYHGELVLNLTQAQGLTRNRYCVGIIAISSQGKMSELSSRSFSVEPAIRRTVMSMDRTPVLELNQTTRFYFTVYDPSGLGTLELIHKDDISAQLPGSSWSCDTRPWSQFRLQCEAILMTHEAKPGRYYFHLRVRNSAPHIGMEFEDPHTMYVDVK